MTQWWEDFPDSVRYSVTRDISSMPFVDSSRGTYQNNFNCQTSSWTVLVLWFVKMDRMSIIATNEIKYTEQHCYNKERKTSYLTLTTMRVTSPLLVRSIQGCLDGTQFAKGWYAVRRNSVILYADIFFFNLKRSNFHQETQHTWYSKSNNYILRARSARAFWGLFQHL